MDNFHLPVFPVQKTPIPHYFLTSITNLKQSSIHQLNNSPIRQQPRTSNFEPQTTFNSSIKQFPNSTIFCYSRFAISNWFLGICNPIYPPCHCAGTDYSIPIHDPTPAPKITHYIQIQGLKPLAIEMLDPYGVRSLFAHKK